MPILAGAAAVAALAWAYLLAAHGGYWRTDQRLPPGAHDASRDPAQWPSVVAIVPARDEAAILPVTLPGLLAQDYPGEFSVVLVDDASTDGTATTAAELAATSARRLLITAAEAPPPGWAGKVHAMAGGLRAAGDCDYLLFTDADIGYAPDMLAALVRGAVADDRALVSQMALLRAESGWERVIVPAFVYFFAQLYPFRRVNRPSARTAAAAGGCMLVRRDTLIAAGGLDPIRGARIDDVALGRLLKRPPSAARIWLGFSTGVRSLRPYPRLATLWDMIARSAYTQLRYSPGLLAATLAGLLWLYALPPVAAVAGLASVATGGGAAAGWTAAAGLAGWAAMSASFLPVLRLYRLGWWRAPLLPLVAGLYAVMTADSARR
ncbi:MAG TPA: glycosyltransferase, partial [Streptosporangiaceae bacterium]